MLLVFVSCGDRHEQSVYTHDDITIDVLLPTTPVKNQGRTTLCWIYAMLATIETDRLAMGDSVNLSPSWLARRSLEEQAVQTYLTRSGISLRGTLPEAMRLYHKYGIVGWDAARPKPTQSRSAERKVQHLARTMAAQHRGLQALGDALDDMLDEELGPMPRFVFMLGAEYTPGEFARSCAAPGEWRAFSSFTHHPYGEPFVLEVPDNPQRHTVMNIPLYALYNKVVSSLRHRHPVAWEGKVERSSKLKSEVSLRSKLKSEKVKELKNGVERGSELKSEGVKEFAEYAHLRQKAFESFRLTDDHCMSIIGLGHLKDGTPVFICKNSWGINDGNHGLRYMTREQFLMSTIMVMIKDE